MKLSVIIVYYKAKDALFGCLKSIEKIKDNNSEVIVVDNDEEKTIEKELKNKFPFVRYIRSRENMGFSAGNNLGALKAKGDFLFFLNPDTIVYPRIFDILLNFLLKNKNIGITAPLLLDKNKKPYPLQGTKELTPLRAIFGLSFVNKIFPNNPVSKDYWLLNWNKEKIKEVDVAPGTAFLIRKKLFEKIGGFDENFFLYFEECDLCKRVKEQGYKIFINPMSKIIHFWGESSKYNHNIDKIFSRSRFYYFKKHYGFFTSFFLHIFLSMNKKMLGVLR